MMVEDGVLGGSGGHRLVLVVWAIPRDARWWDILHCGAWHGNIVPVVQQDTNFDDVLRNLGAYKTFLSASTFPSS